MATSTIYVTTRRNEELFFNKLPTMRWGFCYIERKVTLNDDPTGVWQQGERGTIKTPQGLAYVTRCGVGDGWELEGKVPESTPLTTA